MRTTLLDIAREADVSKTVASDILRGAGSSRFHPKTKRHVLAVARKLNYSPNRAARALVTGRTHLVALWMPHLLSAYYARVAHLLHIQLSTTPYDLLIAHIGKTPPSQVDGVLALVDSESSVARSVEAHRWLKSHSGLPALCLMGCNMDESVLAEADAVNVNLENATRDAVRHLLKNGCRRVAFLTGESIVHEEARCVAFTRAMKAARRKPEYIAVSNSALEPRAAARAAMQEYSTRGSLPDGIICLNDELAIGAHRGLRECNVRVPQDVAIVGCDGIEDTEYIEPGLSTLVQPVEEMCARAWQILQERIETPDAGLQQVRLQAELVIRESSLRG